MCSRRPKIGGEPVPPSDFDDGNFKVSGLVSSPDLDGRAVRRHAGGVNALVTGPADGFLQGDRDGDQ
jgi:hypothetical protein